MFLRKHKEIINDYKRRMEKLLETAIRTRTHFSKKIKKETMGHLTRIGVDEFEALELLEKINDFSITCEKCGSEYLIVPKMENQ
jgi:hypothetical protein